MGNHLKLKLWTPLEFIGMSVKGAVLHLAPHRTGHRQRGYGMKEYPIEWDSGMGAYFFWNEASTKQGYWENREDAEEAFEIYYKHLMEE